MIARALLGGGDLAGSRAIGVSLKIAWELEPSPRSGGQGPAAATGRVRVLFTTVIGEIEREDALVIRAGSTWPIFDIATGSLCGCVSANGVGGKPPSENTRRLPDVGDRAGGLELRPPALAAKNGRRLR